MKNNYFLDKIFNANFREFENIIIAILNELKIEFNDYTFFKTEKNFYLLEVENEEEYIKIRFDDYSMFLKSSKHKRGKNITELWNSLFQTFLTKKQKLQFTKNLKTSLEC